MLARAAETHSARLHPAMSAEDIFRTEGQLKTFKRHTLIYSPGDESTGVHFLSSGEVKLSRYTPEGRELTLDHLNPGSVFGEMEILLDTVRESQAVARSEVVAYVLDSATLLAKMESDPGFGLWMTRQMSARQARMENRLETLLFKSANGKVAQVLVKLAADHGSHTGEGTLIEYPITHQEIGNLIATTRETVSYAFMEFRQMGLISTRQRKTIVRDLDGLEAMALD